MTKKNNAAGLTRRRAFALAATGSAGVVAAGLSARETAHAAELPAGACVVMPEDIEGPYYLDHTIHRADITEGQAGVPFKLRLHLLGTDCRPLVHARVDVWHADNKGIYSGYPNQGDYNMPPVDARGKTYLRGIQFTDANGEVEFTTIYPGWYRGRTPHIHAKIYPHDRAVLNVQMYLPDALNDAVYTQAPGYVRNMARDTLNSNDHFVKKDHIGYLSIREMPHWYEGSLVLAVDPTRVLGPRVIPADMKTHPRFDATPALPPDQRRAALFPSA